MGVTLVESFPYTGIEKVNQAVIFDVRGNNGLLHSDLTAKNFHV